MTTVKPFFSGIDDQIENELNKAKYSIRVAMYSLNDQYLFNILCNKAKSGVAVELVVSPKQLIQNQDKINLERLIEYSGNLFIFNVSSGTYDDMHNKFCIVDYHTVITGSFNWTNQAKRNEENILVVKDELTAQKYLHEFDNLKRGSYLTTIKEDEVQISFSASKSIIQQGEQVELVWNVTNVEQIEISNLGTFANKGTLPIQVDSNSTFTLTTFKNGESKQKTVSVVIAEKPKISFWLSKNLIQQGQTIELNWEVQNAETVEIDNAIGLVPLQGSKTVLPKGDTVYTVIAKGINSELSKKQSVKVVEFPTPVIKTLTIPMPEIKMQTDIVFIKTNLSSGLVIGNPIRNIELSLPQINTIQETLTLPKVYHVQQQTQNEIKRVQSEISEKKKQIRFSEIKKSVFDKLQNYFISNPKMSEVIKTIRKNYE